ncbi:MAG: Asp-tRNA(Asn)/Glu-tRNA(Gln) amidotransferase subunit GatC [Endomicrobium sp.]|jgi:aspartyl-tRNA(Asn)/glutamyl-tRNA(Gln) amidotransferase subunit C|nr:Asp-tRNA(Asn)/Glu-tRNA(Gln) amidotransferase subunit GatC [Endomicrobium sp.]
MLINAHELNNLAFLSKIYIQRQEAINYIQDLNIMLKCVAILHEVNTDNIMPTTHITSTRNVWRQDIVYIEHGTITTVLMKNAPCIEKSTKNFFYKIEKVITK